MKWESQDFQVSLPFVLQLYKPKHLTETEMKQYVDFLDKHNFNEIGHWAEPNPKVLEGEMGICAITGHRCATYTISFITPIQ